MALDVSDTRDKVLNMYGLEGDATAQADAIKALDEAISELNMDLWEHLLSRSSSNALTANQNYITLPTAMYKDKMAFLVRSDGTEQPPLKYVDWPTFKRAYGPNPNAGEPVVYSTFGDEARLYLGPKPDASTAASFTLTVEYYTRLRSATAAAADNDQLDVPAEFEIPLLHKARQFFALLVAGPESPDIPVFQSLYNSAIGKMKEIDRSHPDGVTRFRMYDQYRGKGRGRGGMYIRVD